MCGACGRAVVKDPVLGPERTFRKHLLVAQTVNAVCEALPGAPKVVATADGWITAGVTGSSRSYASVEALWTGILSALASREAAARLFLEEAGTSAGRDETDLGSAVISAGKAVAGTLDPVFCTSR